uniref:EF-hand domain-containing protein n=1 Tax=Physcomitrium patens TaxID=3218 RepID=A0A7I4AB36_PHYPA
MDQWGMARAAAQPTQQQQQQQVQHQQAAHVPQQGVASQYSYSASSYSGQQVVATASAASAAYGQSQTYAQQGYTQQAYQQPTATSAQVGYANTATYGAPAATALQSAQQQQVAWSQQAAAQGAQQADAQQGVYGRTSAGVTSVPSSGGSANAANQYGGQYGAVYAGQQGASQQVLGTSGRSTEDYQPQSVGNRGSTAYGAPQDSRATIGSGASYVVGSAPSVNASGVYGVTDNSKYAEVSKYGEAPKYSDIAKYGDNAKYVGSTSTAGYAGKASEYGGATSPTGYNQKTTSDQFAASYNMKAADYGMAERGHFGQAQNAYGQAGTRVDAVRGYQDAHAVTASSIQQRQSQLLLQQQALQAQQLQATMANRGDATSPLEGATRAQGDYLGRGTAVRTGGVQDYGGNARGMLGGNYGANRAEAELVAQYGGAGGRSVAADPRISAGGGAGYGSNQQASVYGGMSGGRGPGGGQMYGGHSAPAIGYGGVQLPPGRDYSAGRGTGGGGFPVQREGSYGGGRSERPSIGSSRNDDRRDPRPPFRSGGGDRRYEDVNRRNSRDNMPRDSISRDSNSRDRGRSTNRMQVSGGRGPPGGGGLYDREDRERGRDRDRDRRDDDRKRDRSPGLRASYDRKMSPAGDRDDRSRKESPRRDTSYKHASPSKEKRREYVCKIEPYSLVDLERDYSSVSKRYSKLYVVPDFSKVVACWVNRDVELPINKPISFEHDAVDIEDEGESNKEAPPNIFDKAIPSSASAITPSIPTSSKPALQTTVWNAKVMLMSGLNYEAYAEFLSDKSTDDKPAHVHNLLKFVALRKDRSAIMAAGGRWDEELDGGDPTNGDSALIKAAIRCTRDSTQLDLSGCKSWSRIVEVHYERLGEDGLPSHKEITVMFLPTISDCVPSIEAWQAQWKARQQAKIESESSAKKIKDASEKKMPKEGNSNGVKSGKEALGVTEDVSISEGKTDNGDKSDEIQAKAENEPAKVVSEETKEVLIAPEEIPVPGLVLTTRRSKSSKMRSMTISLDGLLDYDEEDREECTFELSLFAEALQELLQHKMGSRILSNLEAIREGCVDRRKEEKKRKVENEKEVEVEGSSSQRKRSKFSDKPDVVEVKAEVDVNFNPDVKMDVEPLKVTEKVEENGTGGLEMENIEVKVESDAVDPQAATLVSAESVVKTLELNGTDDVQEVLKDAEMAQSAETTERLVEDEKLEERKVEKKVVVDQELLLAYRYFDKNRVGYLKSDDLRRLLHSLGKFLSHRNVKDIVACAVTESSKSSRDDRVVYRTFTEKEVEVDVESV